MKALATLGVASIAGQAQAHRQVTDRFQPPSVTKKASKPGFLSKTTTTTKPFEKEYPVRPNKHLIEKKTIVKIDMPPKKNAGMLMKKKKLMPKGKGLIGRPVSAPLATSTSVSNKFTNPNNERFTRKEFVGNLLGSATAGSFSVSSFDINPGDKVTFPWLAGQAAKWEQYHINGLKFHYIARCPGTTTGNILMAPEYDPDDDAPGTEVEMSQYSGVVEDVVWKNISISLDTKAMHGNAVRKFIRTTTVPGSWKNYDCGTFNIAVVDTRNGAGALDTGVIGKLWVEYDITFFVPQGARTTDATKIYSRDATFLTVPPLVATVGLSMTTPIKYNWPVDGTQNGAGIIGKVVGLNEFFDFSTPGTYKISYSINVGATYGVATNQTQVNVEFKNDGAVVLKNYHHCISNTIVGANYNNLVGCFVYTVSEPIADAPLYTSTKAKFSIASSIVSTVAPTAVSYAVVYTFNYLLIEPL